MQLQSVQKEFRTSNDFPVLDFATTDAAHEDIIPLSLNVSQKTVLLNSVYDGIYLCAKINLTSDNSYFAIERKSNYAEEDKEVISPTSTVLAYTLAAMFALTTVVGTGQILYYLHAYFFKGLPLVLEHFLVMFIWMFVLVRTVYFFLVANGFESTVTDYALVALPTFFYFTAFSIIVVLWAVVASKRFTNDVTAFKKVINRSLIIVNGLLYLFFVGLVLAFQFAKTTSDSPCSSRQEADNNSDELRRAISIAYGMIIAGISLIIGVLFVVFGFRIRTFVSVSQSHKKIFIVTGICSVCFILHSIFIVVVSFLSQPNLYFSFVGLIITEWFPALFIMAWLFVQRTSAHGSSNTTDRKSASGKRSGGQSSSRAPVSSTRSRTSEGWADSKTESANVELSQLDVE